MEDSVSQNVKNIDGDFEEIDEGWWNEIIGCPPPPKSTEDATLWLAKFQPERLDEWFLRHDSQLRKWFEQRGVN